MAVRPPHNRGLMHRLWDVEDLRSGYAEFIRVFGPLTRRKWSRHDPTLALKARFAFVLNYLETAWQDPGLPLELLPSRWPAVRAQKIARQLYRTLESPLFGLGDKVLDEIGMTAAKSARAVRVS